MSTRFAGLASLAATLLCLTATTTFADPLPGRDVLKFQQKPLDQTPVSNHDGTIGVYWGHDNISTAYSRVSPDGVLQGYIGQFMADDFADLFDTPVVHVKWWGSYINNEIIQPVDKFLISFESDVPQGPNNPFSHPGTPLLNQIVRRGPLAPGSGTFTEAPISPGGPPLDERLYEYNAELHLDKEFFQKPDTVYWLKIVALVDVPAGTQPGADPVTQWGWHNRDYTMMDPLASTAPAVVPGEHIAGTVGGGPVGGGTSVWHFQDDAVTGRVLIDTASTSNGEIMPLVEQGEFRPTHYRDLVDGPDGISQFSQDLAFELYTVVPEPTTVLLLLAGGVMLGAVGRRGC